MSFDHTLDLGQPTVNTGWEIAKTRFQRSYGCLNLCSHHSGNTIKRLMAAFTLQLWCWMCWAQTIIIGSFSACSGDTFRRLFTRGGGVVISAIKSDTKDTTSACFAEFLIAQMSCIATALVAWVRSEELKSLQGMWIGRWTRLHSTAEDAGFCVNVKTFFATSFPLQRQNLKPKLTTSTCNAAVTRMCTCAIKNGIGKSMLATLITTAIPGG